MRRSVFLPLLVLTLFGGAAECQEWKILKSFPLPAELRWAQDARWASETSAFVSSGRSGVYEVPLAAAVKPRRIIEGAGPQGFWFSARLATSARHVLTAAPINGFAWWDRSTGQKVDENAFAVVMDVDLHDDRVAILGADRDAEGRFAPEGAIVWWGPLNGSKKLDLQPLFFSTAGSGVKPMAQCHYLETGAVRFTPSGELVVLPGVEPGVFLFDKKGKLLRTWATERLGVVDRCALSEQQFLSMSSQPGPRWEWLQRRKVVDDVVVLRSGPALIIRTVSGSATHWDLVELQSDSGTKRVTLPIVSVSPLAHLRADVDSKGRLMVLRLEYGELATAPAEPPMLYIMERR